MAQNASKCVSRTNRKGVIPNGMAPYRKLQSLELTRQAPI